MCDDWVEVRGRRAAYSGNMSVVFVDQKGMKRKENISGGLERLTTHPRCETCEAC